MDKIKQKFNGTERPEVNGLHSCDICNFRTPRPLNNKNQYICRYCSKLKI